MASNVPVYHWQQIISFLDPGTRFFLTLTNKRFSQDLPLLLQTSTPKTIVHEIVRVGAFSTASWMLEHCSPNRVYKFTYFLFATLLTYSHVDVIAALEKTTVPIDWQSSYMIYCAIKGGVRSLTFLHKVKDSHIPSNCTLIAAKLGKLDCLRYLFEVVGCEWDYRACSVATEKGHLACVQYMHTHGYTLTTKDSSLAALSGNLEILTYLHKNNCPWDENTCSCAAQTGFLNCLRYAHENGCPWDEWTTYLASSYDEVECLRYALDNGCAVDFHRCIVATTSYPMRTLLKTFQGSKKMKVK